MINNIMQYLTNYYKNLCEQLQEKMNILEAQLNELNFGPGGIKPFSDPEFMKIVLSGGGADNSKRIPTTFKPSYIPRHDQPYQDQNKQPEKRRKLNPGYEYGLDGEPVYVGDTEPIKPFRGFKPEDLYVGGKSNLRPRTSQTSAESEGETDEDIYRMRQTAADQGGIPQSMVNEPINRPKQMPKTSNNPYYDGRLDSDGNFVPKPPPRGMSREDGYWDERFFAERF